MLFQLLQSWLPHSKPAQRSRRSVRRSFRPQCEALEDRLTMSALMEVSPDGRIVAYELAPGVIRSAERMTYTAVNAVLTEDASACREYHSQLEHFKRIHRLDAEPDWTWMLLQGPRRSG